MNQAEQKTLPPPENSLGYRVVILTMSLMCISASSLFVHTPLATMVLYLWAAVTGAYLSYRYRSEKKFWVIWIIVLGLMAAISNFLYELATVFDNGPLSLLGPIIRMICAMIALVSFESRSRIELNSAALLSLMALSMCAAVARGIDFCLCALAYILLGTLALYFDNHSCTNRQPAASSLYSNHEDQGHHPVAQRKTSFAMNMIVWSCLPLISLMTFTLVPRGDYAADQLLLCTKQLLEKWSLLDLLGFPQQPGIGEPGSGNFMSGLSQGGGAGTKGGASKSSGSGQDKQPKNKHDKENKNRHYGTKSSGLDTNEPLQGTDELLFRATTSRPVYFRQNSYDYFDGRCWSTVQDTHESYFLKPTRGFYDLSQHRSFALPEAFPSIEVVQDFLIDSELGTLMPVGGIPQRVDYAGVRLSIDGQRRLIAVDPLKKGTKYRIFAQVPIYSRKQLRNLAPLDRTRKRFIVENLAAYLQVPEKEDPKVIVLARAIVQPGLNWFSQCEQIVSYLRTNCATTLNKSKSSKYTNSVDRFLLESKQGDCKDFASAFTILCRISGIPARCVSGYKPGTVNPVTGMHDVTLKDAHVWSEVYIPGYDWVPFDATLKGVLPDRPPQENYSLANLKQQLDAQSKSQQEAENKTISRKRTNAIKLVLRIAGYISAAVLGLITLLFLGNKWLRWRKENASLHPAQRLYRRVVGKLKLIKIKKQANETNGELLARIRSGQTTNAKYGANERLPQTLDQFLKTYAAIYFGRQEKMSELQELAEKVERELTGVNIR
jgi:transglutaminase-like putative cysteine protease